MKKLLLCFAVLILASCNQVDKTNAPSPVSIKDTHIKDSLRMVADKRTHDSLEALPKWTYFVKTDEMTSKKKYFAQLTSDDNLGLNAPYEGENHGNIDLRFSGNGNEVLLIIDKGQFNSDIEDGMNIKVRFDEMPAVSYKCEGSSTHESTTAFIKNSSDFISKIKKASKVIIQAEFFDNGVKTMHFTCKGLKWEH